MCPMTHQGVVRLAATVACLHTFSLAGEQVWWLDALQPGELLIAYTPSTSASQGVFPAALGMDRDVDQLCQYPQRSA